MNILIKIILSILSIIMMIVPKPIYANEQVSADEFGSIKLILDDVEKGSKENVIFEIYKVADFKDGLLELVGNYTQTDIDLNTIKTANDLENVADILSQVSGTATASKQTNKDGIALFDNLEVGAYLIKPTDTTNYDDVSPYIVSIPTFNEIDGTMVYDIESYPKHSPKPQLPKTGDNSINTVTIIAISTISLMVLVGIILIKKKRQGK